MLKAALEFSISENVEPEVDEIQMSAIITERLTKSFDNKKNIVDSLCLNVPEGIAYGLVGGSSSGKTTAVKLMAGLLVPDSGRSLIMDLDPMKTPARLHKICGTVTPSANMYGGMTGKENLVFFGEAAGLKAEDAQVRAAELMKDLGIWQARDLLVREFPTGMLQRLSIARALMGRPRVLLLDEPTAGMDTEGAEAVLAVISGLVREEGVTALLCTHQLVYAQQLCTQFGILVEGKLIADGSLETLCQTAGCRVRAGFRLAEGIQLPNFTQNADGYWEKELESDEEMPELLRKTVEADYSIYEARLSYPTLTDAYTVLTDREGLL